MCQNTSDCYYSTEDLKLNFQNRYLLIRIYKTNPCCLDHKVARYAAARQSAAHFDEQSQPDVSF